MGLRAHLARAATGRVHVLVVGLPGHRRIESTVDGIVRKRGWVVADSPADADVLAVCGSAGPQLAAAIDHVWAQLPGPRVRIRIDDHGQIDSALQRAAAELTDLDRHRADAHHRNDHSGDERGDAEREHEQMSHGDMDHGDMDHGDRDHGDVDHGDVDHSDMDHSDMDHGAMAPAGIPLAEGDDDRDGLEMDVLHLPLGPILSHWPAGVVVRCTLHGDVVVDSHVEVLDSDTLPAATTDAQFDPVHQCSTIIDVLALAGAETAERQARTARDRLVDGAYGRARAEVDGLRRRLRRSPILRWSLRDLGRLEHDRAEALDVADHRPALTGDVYDRLVARVDHLAELLSGAWTQRADTDPARTPRDVICELINGLDLAAARLVIAGLGIDAVAIPVEPVPVDPVTVDTEGRGPQNRPSHRGHHHG